MNHSNDRSQACHSLPPPSGYNVKSNGGTPITFFDQSETQYLIMININYIQLNLSHFQIPETQNQLIRQYSFTFNMKIFDARFKHSQIVHYAGVF